MFHCRPKSIGDKYRREIHWLNRKIRKACACWDRKMTKSQVQREILDRIKYLKARLKGKAA